MMKATKAFLVAFAAAGLSSAGLAEHAEPEAANDPAPSVQTAIAVDQLVDGRRAGYWMSAGLFGGMFNAISNDADVKPLAFGARALAGWARALPGMFPENSVNAKSNALPTIWSDRAEFEAVAALYAERTTQLAQIAETGDKQAFKAQWMEVRKTCSTCHEKFRRDRKAE